MGHLPSLVHTGSGSVDSASVLDAQIALCSVMARLVIDRRLIQVIRRSAATFDGRVHDQDLEVVVVLTVETAFLTGSARSIE